MKDTELDFIKAMKGTGEDPKLLRRGTKVRHNGKGYEYFLSDRKWVKRHQVRKVK